MGRTEFFRLDEQTSLNVLLALPLGSLLGAAFGLMATVSTMGATGAAFIAGYLSPLILGRLDAILRRIFAGKEAPLGATGASRPLDLLQPIDLLTHFIAGAVLSVMFLLVCGQLSPTSPILSNINPVLQQAGVQITLLPILTATIGGAFGAWLHITADIVAAVSAQKARGGGEAPRIPQPFLQYLSGAIAGGLFAFVLPSSLVVATTGLSVFNPFTLALIALLAGYWAPNSLRSVFAGTISGAGAAAVEEGVRRALTPPPLVNFSGYLVGSLLRADTLASCMLDGVAVLEPQVSDYILDLQFVPLPTDGVSGTPVTIENGVDGKEAVFDLEISVEELAPRRRRAQIVARTGTASVNERLPYALQQGSEPGEQSRIQITVSQGGRPVQFATLRLGSGPRLERASLPG